MSFFLLTKVGGACISLFNFPALKISVVKIIFQRKFFVVVKILNPRSKVFFWKNCLTKLRFLLILTKDEELFFFERKLWNCETDFWKSFLFVTKVEFILFLLLTKDDQFCLLKFWLGETFYDWKFLLAKVELICFYLITQERWEVLFLENYEIEKLETEKLILKIFSCKRRDYIFTQKIWDLFENYEIEKLILKI